MERHRRVVLGQRHMIVETTGRVSGKKRRTVVGCHREGTTIWVVAEQGRRAGYVRNLEANPSVRLASIDVHPLEV